MLKEKKLSIIKLMDGIGLKRYGRMDGMVYFIFDKDIMIMSIGGNYCVCNSGVRYSRFYKSYIRKDYKKREYHIARDYNKIMEWIEEMKLSIKEAQGYKKKIELLSDFGE